jgi:hypothetical protein
VVTPFGGRDVRPPRRGAGPAVAVDEPVPLAGRLTRAAGEHGKRSHGREGAQRATGGRHAVALPGSGVTHARGGRTEEFQNRPIG